MEITNTPIEDLVPYTNNPRKNDKAVDSVAKSIQEFGFKVPIILDNDNVIITGHTRLKAAKQLGMKEVPTIKAEDLTPEQVKAFRIMDNKSQEYSGWDWELFNLINDSFTQVNQHLIKNGSIYVFHSSSNQIIFEKALNNAGFEIKQQLIWNKHHVLGRSHYHWCHEPLFYGCRIGEAPLFVGTRSNRTILNTLDPEKMTIEELKRLVKKIKEESTMWDIKKDNSQDYIHPTQKPTKLAIRAMVNSSKVGDIILDPFAGSGSTLMACEERNRVCYTIELDPVFCSHIIQRWEDSTGNKVVKLTKDDK